MTTIRMCEPCALEFVRARDASEEHCVQRLVESYRAMQRALKRD